MENDELRQLREENARLKDQTEILDEYGQIIVDECHHLSAFSFEAILKQAKAKYIVGLTATPIRRDGHHPIIFMQCGPLRHRAKLQENIPEHLEVWPKNLAAPEIPPESTIQHIFRIIANNKSRNQQIVKDVLSAYHEGRKILVLTERTDHLNLLSNAIGDDIEHLFVLHGRLPKKQPLLRIVRAPGAPRTALRQMAAEKRGALFSQGLLGCGNSTDTFELPKTEDR